MLKDLAIHYECLPGENMPYFGVDSVFICKTSLNCAKITAKKLHKKKPVPEALEL